MLIFERNPFSFFFKLPFPAKMAAASSKFCRAVGSAVRESGSMRGGGGWYTPHMATAARAIRQRIPLVDLVVEVRDARIPITSAFEPLKQESCSNKHIVALNKADLADRSMTEKWVKHFRKKNHICFGVNAHNKDSIKGLLNLVRTRIRELKGTECNYTATVLLTGIPNVGKSAIANSMHQIGRISAEEKGKLKHAVVSPQPGETKDINSYKIASHPNIYILDSPGVLYPEVADDDYGSKLALTGAIKDSLAGEIKLAQYFLAVLNSAEEYRCWENLKDVVPDRSFSQSIEKRLVDSDSGHRRRKQYSTDHTQDFIVRDVRRTLFKTISLFNGCLENETDMERLIEAQFDSLQETFRLSLSGEDARSAVAAKLLNLYRTGRLGHYTLDLLSTIH